MDLRRAPAEVDIDEDLARALLRDQRHELADGPLELVDEGWDNVTYRVGQKYAIRIPRRRVAVDLLLTEQRWLPTIAARLPVAVPRPVVLGVPTASFPWPWSVVEWIPGSTADRTRLSVDQAPVVAVVLRALHRPVTDEAPSNPFRGVPLAARQEVVEERLARLGLSDLVPIWREAIRVRPATDRVWIHGDLHGRNVVVRDGALAGIIDWGDLTGGDVATDLACAWMLFDTGAARTAFFEAYGSSDDSVARAAGWAVNLAAALLDSGEPRHVEMGRAVVNSLQADGT
jgi:aminoglycoside phosphotransferase (APT) family kinase protein